MDITHVIRGEDHIANTPSSYCFIRLWTTVPTFAHAPLILNAEGRKLSKRDGVTSINDFRAMGYTAEAIANYMTLLGWSVPEGMEERFTLQEAAEVFSFERVNKAGARFDWDKLNWLNAQVLHGLSSESLLSGLQPLWEKRGWQLPVSASPAWGLDLCTLLGPSLTLMEDGVDQARPFFERPDLEADAEKQLAVEGAAAAIQALVEALQSSPWTGDDQALGQALLADAAKAAGVKKGVIMKSLRAALLGRLQGPDRSRPGHCWPGSARTCPDLNAVSASPQVQPAPLRSAQGLGQAAGQSTLQTNCHQNGQEDQALKSASPQMPACSWIENRRPLTP